MKLQQNLREHRNKLGLSQEQLAEKLYISRQAIAKWENGTAQPELDKLVLLTAIYQITLDELVNGINCCDTIHPPETFMTPDYNVLIEFLLRASSKTYAGKGAEAITPCRECAHDFSYAEEGYRYTDSYFGGQRFIGEESLYEQGVCIWGMNYAGRTLSERFSGDFLKSALLLRPKTMPYRGPMLYRDGRYTYHNSVEGDFRWFQGREEIYTDTELVFQCMYHGGIVQA